MKSHLFKIIPVIIALSLVSFRHIEKRTSYYWFYYNNGLPIPLGAFEFPCPDSPYDCSEVGAYICTRAYATYDTELFLEGFTLKRRPKSGGVVQAEIKKHFP